ncbi:fimbrial protein [Burkholderia ubonensis]|uniref:fimbrial protein n=1 Tax=Burkholderia ubonensis TaxID=101571 RepID=UPI00075FF17E|nr:fimbrial protein [Burkholderia ubonensis]KWN87813.1 hypothetical protein WM25_30615 [Burkholderia ubonensis]
MNTLFKWKHPLLALACALASWATIPVAHAACTITNYGTVLSPTVPASFSGARDGQTLGALVGTGAQTSEKAVADYSFECEIERITATAVGKLVPNVSYAFEGRSHPVYETGIPGIGYALMARAGVYPGGGTWYALPTTETVLNRGRTNTLTQFRVAIVFTGSLVTGSYSVPLRTVATVRAYSNGSTREPRDVYLPALNVKVATSSCSLTSGANNTVTLPTVYQGSMKSVGSVSAESGNVTLNVACQGQVSVYVTLTDISNPTNTSNVLGLTPGSQAAGIGIQLFKQGNSTALGFGPDSTGKGNTNQWLAGKTTNGTVSIPLVAKYVRTAPDVTPGPVDARASFTFSYQ